MRFRLGVAKYPERAGPWFTRIRQVAGTLWAPSTRTIQGFKWSHRRGVSQSYEIALRVSYTVKHGFFVSTYSELN